jgi:terminase large subunit-like protein
MAEAAEELTVNYEPLLHQYKVLQSEKKNTFMFGGVGSGKTEVGSTWVLKRGLQTPPGVMGLISANSYMQLIDSTMTNVFKNFDAWGIPYTPKELPRNPRPFDFYMWNTKTWVKILCRSLDRFHLLAGVELGWGWLDEVYQTKKEAIDLVRARVRDTRFGDPALMPKKRTQPLMYSTTLDDPDSWMYADAEENLDPRLDRVIYAKTIDNPHLPDDYIPSLAKTYSPALYKRMVECKWVYLIGSTIYNLDKQLHVSDIAEFNPDLPILWCHDFNIGIDKPMSSALCHIVRRPGIDGEIRRELHIFDEIIIDSADTHEAVVEFKARDWLRKTNAGVIIYGDASGRAKDTRSKTSDYKILKDAGFNIQKVPLANPPIRTRHNVMNGLFQNQAGDVRMKINPRCKTVTKGFGGTKLKQGSAYIEEESREQHVTTAVGYLACQEFPLKKYGSSGEKYWK